MLGNSDFFTFFADIFPNIFLQVLEIPIYYENFDEAEGSPECEFIPRSLPKQPDPDNERKVNRS